MREMVHLLGCWIPNPGIISSKPLGGSKINPALHPSEVNQMRTSTSWQLRNLKSFMNFSILFLVGHCQTHPAKL